MSDAQASSFDLPEELEREIFELAGSAFSSCVPRLSLVSWKVNKWISPLLYRVLRVDDLSIKPPIRLKEDDAIPTQNHLCALDFDQLKPFAQHVRHVLIQNRKAEDVLHILQVCTSVKHLALWIISGDKLPIAQLLQGFGLESLSMDPRSILGNLSRPLVSGTQPLFRAMSHLEIINCHSTSWDVWKELASMPQLSHLALHGVPFIISDLYINIINNCLRIETLICISYFKFSGDNPTADAFGDEYRIVFYNPSIDVLNEWEVGARGGEDIWVVADRMKEERRTRIQKTQVE